MLLLRAQKLLLEPLRCSNHHAHHNGVFSACLEPQLPQAQQLRRKLQLLLWVPHLM